MTFGVCATIRRMITVLSEGRFVAARDAGWWRDRQQIKASADSRTTAMETTIKEASASLTDEAQNARAAVEARNETTDALIERTDRTRRALNLLVSRFQEINHHGG